MPIAGTNCDFHLDNAGAALTEISSYLRSAKITKGSKTQNVETFGNGGWEEVVATLKNSTITVEGFYDPTPDAIFDSALGSATTKSFRLDPTGPGAGKVSYTGECICTAYDINPPVDGVVTFSATLQVTGAVTRTVL